MSDMLSRLTAALLDRYALEREIGQGGMATVYLARDLKHDRQVAIKVLRPDLGVMLGSDRFLQEIRLTANLQHPHIVALYDSGEADGFLYYVMPYVEGESLRERLNREGKLPTREAARIATDVAAALDYAHRRDIVHRDIKPENILLHEGAVLVADFGIARAAAAAGGDRLTAVGLAVGTPAYMSPEQAAGTSDADARSDVYSLGCVLYEMLSGKPPFTAPTAQQVLSKQVVAEPPPLTDSGVHVSGAVTGVVQRALAKEPSARYQTAQEFSAALDEAAVTGAVAATGSGAWLVEALLRPRTLAMLGGYLALAVAVVAGVKWLAGRFLLSSQLPWLVGTGLLALLPAVAIVASQFGGEGRRRSGRAVGLGIPANVLAAAALLFVLFGRADLGSATTAVSVRNEMGDLIDRAIPKAAYRRRVALFPVDNPSGDSALNWVRYAVPAAVSVDLGQDPFVQLLGPREFGDDLEEAGKPNGLDVPVALKRRIASQRFMEYFTGGEVTRDDDGLVLTIDLFDVGRGALVERRTYRGGDVLGMVDELSLQLREDLGIPSGALASTPDLPATELLTDSRDAFRAYVDGWTAMFEGRYQDAVARLDAAVAADPSFAVANLELYEAMTETGRADAGAQALEQAIEHSYRLNERTQIAAKFAYYFLVRQDAEKALAVVTMWTDLYPEDPDGHMQRAQQLRLRNDLAGVIDELQQVVALDSNRYDVLRTIGSIYASRGVFDTAQTYLEAYLERQPENPDAYKNLAGLALLRADFDRAGELYDRALLLDAGDALALKGLGDVARSRGEMQVAADRYGEALAQARTASQRSAVLSAFSDLYEVQGKTGEAVTYLDRSFAALSEASGPFLADQLRLQNMGVYARGGMTGAALDSVRTIGARLGDAFASITALGYLDIAFEIDSVPMLEEAIEATDTLIARFGLEAVRPLVLRAQGRVLELQDRCADALPLYEQVVALEPTMYGFEVDVGRCLGATGRLDDAQRRLQAMVQKWPAFPQARYELASVLVARGDTAAAHVQLDRALEIWRDADPGYRPAQKAHALDRTLGGGNR